MLIALLNWLNNGLSRYFCCAFKFAFVCAVQEAGICVSLRLLDYQGGEHWWVEHCLCSSRARHLRLLDYQPGRWESVNCNCVALKSLVSLATDSFSLLAIAPKKVVHCSQERALGCFTLCWYSFNDMLPSLQNVQSKEKEIFISECFRRVFRSVLDWFCITSWSQVRKTRQNSWKVSCWQSFIGTWSALADFGPRRSPWLQCCLLSELLESFLVQHAVAGIAGLPYIQK